MNAGDRYYWQRTADSRLEVEIVNSQAVLSDIPPEANPPRRRILVRIASGPQAGIYALADPEQLSKHDD